MHIQPGRLNARLKLQQPVIADDSSGGRTITAWQDVSYVWGMIKTKNSAALLDRESEGSATSYTITLRAHHTITTGMRLLWKGHTIYIDYAPTPLPGTLYQTIQGTDQAIIA